MSGRLAGEGPVFGPTGSASLGERLPTGVKLVAILSAALLPLAIVAIYMISQTNSLADQEVRSRLRVAATEASRALAIELNGDMNALRVTVNALDDQPDNLASCARAQGVFAEQIAAGARFSITDKSGKVHCGANTTLPGEQPQPLQEGAIGASVVPGRGLVLSLSGPSGRLTATTLFPDDFLTRVARPSGFTQPIATEIIGNGRRLQLESITGLGPMDRVETVNAPLGIGDFTLVMRVRSAPITSALLLAMLLPMLMWVAATGIGWFVVDQLLIRPLRRLRRAVAAYSPGQIIDTGAFGAIPAREIRELGETFQAINRTVNEHEAGLAEGLVRQTKLTREVHHRVKNNLQVISSLINFHSRSAPTPEAAAAYSSIQRRVDALAVVHRNNYAELEENRGVSLRSVIGELASNLRATLPDEASGMTITLDIDSAYANQDSATAVTFLITELVELALVVDPAGTIRIELHPSDDEERCWLRLSSPAFADGESLHQIVATRYDRVLEGLSRQMRAPLEHQGVEGSYCIAVAIVGRDQPVNR